MKRIQTSHNLSIGLRGRWVVVALCLLMVLPGCTPAEVAPGTACPVEAEATHPRSAQIVEVMNKYVKAGLPGMSVLVRDSAGARFVGAAGMADIGQAIPFAPCNPSKGASITKLHVAVLAHRLHEQGVLDIDAPLERYIEPGILRKIKGAQNRTVGMLMNHTTGIYDLITTSDFYLAVLNRPNHRWTPDELLPFIYGVEPYALNDPYPAQYSSTNTLLLMMCIEQATGRSHVDLLREQIWGPLGMADTYMQGREDLPKTATHGYYDLYQNNTLADVSQLVTGSGNGFGGIFSTTRDLETFMDALFVNRTLVSPASLDKMYAVVQEDTNFYCGVGTIRKYLGRGRHYGIGHTGRDLGYNANCFWYPREKALIVFFVNYGTNGDSDLKQTFFEFEEELVRVALD